jgi:hypothetical protein
MKSDLLVDFRKFQRTFFVVGAIGCLASAVGVFVEPRQFFFSYLFSYLFWLGLSLGCLAVTMMHFLAGGRWGYSTRRFLEAGFMVLPAMLLLMIPIFFGLHYLYPWAQPAAIAASSTLRERHAYENNTAYILRQVLFLAVFIGMALKLRQWSLQQDMSTDAAPTRKARALSGPGLVAYGLLGTFASVDWILSLEPQWRSTMFGVILLIGQILTAYAFAITLLATFKDKTPFSEVADKVHFHHLGNLLLAFTLFWTYVCFGQLLIIYSGDLPHELEWYRHRIAGSWKAVVTAIALFHFFLPFFLLLFRAIKMRVTTLAALAAMLFVMHIVDMYWLVMPTLHPNGLSLSWLDFTAPIGIGGLWLALFFGHLKAAPLVPRNDPGKQFAFVYAKS